MHQPKNGLELLRYRSQILLPFKIPEVMLLCRVVFPVITVIYFIDLHLQGDGLSDPPWSSGLSQT